MKLVHTVRQRGVLSEQSMDGDKVDRLVVVGVVGVCIEMTQAISHLARLAQSIIEQVHHHVFGRNALDNRLGTLGNVVPPF